MRRGSRTSFWFTALAVLVSSDSGAAPFTGTLLLQIGSLPAVSIPGSGSGDPTLPSISADAFVGSVSTPVSGQPPFTQVLINIGGNVATTVRAGATFSTGPGGFGAFPGARIFGIGFNALPVTFARVGVEGASKPFDRDTFAQVDFGGWTTGVATISRTHTANSGTCVAGSATCPTGMLGADTANLRFFGGSAQIVLVAPVDIHSTLVGGHPSFVVLALNYVPEPGALALLLSGGLVLAGLGRRRPR